MTNTQMNKLYLIIYLVPNRKLSCAPPAAVPSASIPSAVLYQAPHFGRIAHSSYPLHHPLALLNEQRCWLQRDWDNLRL